MKISKMSLCIIALSVFFVISAAVGEPIKSERFSLYYIPSRSSSALDSFLTDNDPPLVKTVKITPEQPGIGDEVTVEAEIINNKYFTNNKPLLANLSYSLDLGATWKMLEMDQSEDNPDIWQAVIPATGKPGAVRYFFTVKDDGGNYLFELPAVRIEWGGIKPPALTGVLTDENEDSRIVFDDLDILQAQAGYDGSILYFAMKVEGDVSGGTVSPFNVFVYSIGIYYPDKIKGGTIRTNFVLEHSQHAQFLLFPIIGLLDTEEGLNEVRSADARYYSKDGWLYMRFKEDVLKNKRFDKLRIIYGTAYATIVDPLTLTPDDTTGSVNLVHVERAFDVK